LKTYVATKNAGKLRELRELFAGSPLDLEVYPGYIDVDEDAASYVGNAMLKARALEGQLRDDDLYAAVLSDDSGLEVDALGGGPGILSARYAGSSSTWEQRRGLLLSEMHDVAEDLRTARFVCVMVLLLPQGEPHVTIGSVEGRITRHEIGDGGFGYDSIFYYPPLARTFAELRAEEKNAVSHRHRAADLLLASLQRRG
jgi:XTP/dITP diphosphohydrolase